MKLIPAAGLVEPLRKEDLWQAVPAVYRKQDHIAILNLGPTVTISKGTQIGIVTPVHMDKQKEKIGSVRETAQDTENLEQLYQELKIDNNPRTLYGTVAILY